MLPYCKPHLRLIVVVEKTHNPVINSNELHYDTGESEPENQSLYSIYPSNNESDSFLVESEDDNNHLYCCNLKVYAMKNLIVLFMT
ncbi:hypothetical protein RN001_006120 [Aquatica leii]|uniref:Uncharacterized protein n=1 Tax=Aquatica leii TaxID=1421715 RepID=A0AAN7PKS7_9COLE|nr:hypothetical protein RN001_006120 [Aquatica leii]